MPSSSYSVTIAAISGATPSDGFVDPVKVEHYHTAGSPLPATFEQSVTKERANLRWMFVENKLQTLGNIYVRDKAAPGGSSSAAPTSVTFTAFVEHGDGGLVTYDELNGNALITGAAAIKRVIARALRIAVVRLGEAFDPTATATEGNDTPEARYGFRRENIEVGPLGSSLANAEASITVTKL